jgi:hypothetical protein
MPEIDLSEYSKLAPVDLEQRRRAIIAKANGQHDNLTIDELHELAAITGAVRRVRLRPPNRPTERRSRRPNPSSKT